MEVDETPNERLTRNVNELLQELRVAQAGVQILFGFLFSVTFTSVYQDASRFQKDVHLVAVLLAVCAVALMTGPVAWHRILFRKGRREKIVRTANRLAIAGLIFLAAAMSTTVLLLGDLVLNRWAAILASTLCALGFGCIWFLLPLKNK